MRLYSSEKWFWPVLGQSLFIANKLLALSAMNVCIPTINNPEQLISSILSKIGHRDCHAQGKGSRHELTARPRGVYSSLPQFARKVEVGPQSQQRVDSWRKRWNLVPTHYYSSRLSKNDPYYRNLQDGSRMKHILYESESAGAEHRKTRSFSTNYNDIYQRQQARIAKTYARSPSMPSKIGQLVARDRNQFASR